MYLIQRFIRTFCPFITHEQYFNTVFQDISVPEQRKLFLHERYHKLTTEKWILLFKYLMKIHTLIDMGELLYERFCNAGLRLQYLELGKKKQHYFLISQWPT